MLQVGLLCAFATATVASAGAQNAQNSYPRADIEYGSKIFRAQCTGCHGVNGDQVAGVNLAAGQFRSVLSDADLRAVVSNGIPGTPMPPFH